MSTDSTDLPPLPDLPPPPPPPSAPDPSHRRSAVLALGGAGLAVLLTVAALVSAHLRHTDSVVPAATVPGIAQTPGTGPCLDEAKARAVWDDVSQRLDALALHPDLDRVGDVAEGTAAEGLRRYLQDTLISKHLTEREKERVDALNVVQPGCGGQPLTVRLTETLVQDDYLAADGHVDHQDPGVGQQHHLIESFVRAGDTWKVITIAPLDAPSQEPGQVV